MEARLYAVCYWCGKKVAYVDCSVNCAVHDDALCNALKGWSSVGQCIGQGNFYSYLFCSYTCIQMWGNDMAPTIPEPILKAFIEE